MTKYSDVLGMFLLKGLRPEKYRERMEMHAAIGKINLELLPDPLIDRIANGENVLSVLASAVSQYGAEIKAALESGERGARGLKAGESADVEVRERGAGGGNSRTPKKAKYLNEITRPPRLGWQCSRDPRGETALP